MPEVAVAAGVDQVAVGVAAVLAAEAEVLVAVLAEEAPAAAERVAVGNFTCCRRNPDFC